MDTVQDTLHFSFVGRDNGDVVDICNYGASCKFVRGVAVECFVNENE